MSTPFTITLCLHSKRGLRNYLFIHIWIFNFLYTSAYITLVLVAVNKIF